MYATSSWLTLFNCLLCSFGVWYTFSIIAYYNECNWSTAPPRFTSKPPPLIFIKEGGNLTLSISVSGNPQPKITWSVRLKIHENQSRVNSTGDDKFELKNVRFEDEGVIACRAENLFGVQETEVELTVLGEFLTISFLPVTECVISVD